MGSSFKVDTTRMFTVSHEIVKSNSGLWTQMITKFWQNGVVKFTINQDNACMWFSFHSSMCFW